MKRIVPRLAAWAWRLCLALAMLAGPLTAKCRAQELSGQELEHPFSALELHGFLEQRMGARVRRDPLEKQASILETRLQGEASTHCQWAQFKLKGDIWHDGVAEATRGDLREAWASFQPAGSLDVKAGRQVLTWGTGDLVFLNDLFPKDWQAFFIGRDAEYLKAPTDSLKLSAFTELANLDLVYTPRFVSDRFITGERISHWNDRTQSLAGRDDELAYDRPNRWFEDDEVSARLHQTFGANELALYGYWGFWKGPAGQNAVGESIFPRLNVYGASFRSPLGPGILNLETAWYQSAQDEHGRNPNINNSELRHLVGYAQELARELNISAQYYVEQILDYGNYRAGFLAGRPRDEHRHVLTLQLTQLLLNQDLELSLSGYYSPSDTDAYIRPKARYTFTDRLSGEIGANVFVGRHAWTMFGQYENNSNVYTGLRYSF